MKTRRVKDGEIQSTHWETCWKDGGPRHWACAVARVERLEAALADAQRHIGDPRPDVCRAAIKRARAALAGEAPV